MTKVQSKDAFLYDIANDNGDIRDAMVETIGDATTVDAGLMAAADKTKLDGVAAGATVNSADAALLARGNHTGAQAMSTVTGLVDALAGKATTAQGALADTALQPADGAAFATAAQGALADTSIQPADLATVATSGSYADLTGLPTLGTAAAANTGDFATAAQGALADTAVQPEDIDALGLPAIVANTMLVDNAAGDARETKTFAEVVDLLSLGRNIRHYGGSGSSDNAAAIAAMAADVGFVRFPSGNSLISTALTIDAPMYFDPDAYITAATGIDVKLTNTINAPRGQWIFRGDGTFTIPLPDADSGEDTREVYAGWWGVVTQVPLDQSVKIQKIFDALGNSRESLVHFDHGSIQIEGPMLPGRGTRIRGSGTRRTVFEVLGTAYTVFETAQTACFFEDIQFENIPKPSSPARTAPYIHIKHDFCEIKNIFHHPAYNAIIVDGPNCKVENVEGVYGSANPGAGSSQILIRATGVSTKGIFCRYSSTYWPTYIVEIGTGAAGSVTAFFVDQVEYVGGSVGVFVHGDGVAVARGQIWGVNARGASGTPPQVVLFKTTGSGEIFSVPVNGLVIPNTATAAVTFKQDSSASIRRVSLDGIQDAGSSGNCIEFIQTAGSINNIAIGAAVQTARSNDITETMATAGGVTAISVAMRGRRKGKNAGFAVPASGIEDGVVYHVQSAAGVTVTLPNNVNGSVPLSFQIAASAGATLSISGGTINGGATKALTANQLYTVAMTRNAGNCQWFTQA